MDQWLVLRTHPNCEKMAIRHIRNQGFTPYQPLIMDRKTIRSRVQMVPVPLFPNYIFVQLIERGWYVLKSTYGVSSIVGGSSSPSILRGCVVDDLRRRERNGLIQLPQQKHFAVGDKVIIQKGLFAGQQALVDRMPAKERQKVLLNLLSNHISVLVDESDLEEAA